MKKQIRILMVMASPFRSGLAPENYIRARAVYDNPEFDVDILCFPIGEDVFQSNVNVLRVPKKKVFRSYQIGEYKKILYYTLCIQLKLLFKRDKKYDVIFLFNASYLFFWLIRPFFHGKVIATIYTSLHGELVKWDISGSKLLLKLLIKYEKYILGKYDFHLFNALKIKQDYENEGYDPQKALLINHATEIREFSRDERVHSDSFIVLYVGSFVQVQNIDLIYQVAYKLKHLKNIRFILVGVTDREYKPEYDKIQKLSLDNVELHKHVDQQRLDKFYQNANILISCRITGGDLPFKIIEYMSWGKCILATDRPIHNIILNKNIACLVEPEPEIIASRILELIKDPALVKLYEDNIKKYFLANHSFSIMKEKYFNLVYRITEHTNKY